MDRLFNIIRNQFIDVIEWTDDSRDTLSFRWPDEDKEIKNGAQLIVRESQLVQFVAAGQFADLFGPGKYTLTTENIPILSTILGWKYGFQSLPEHAALHGQQVGHGQSGDDAGPGFRCGSAAGVRHL